jgi:hypothetical protein
MSCNLKPCRDLSDDKISIYIQYADTVYQMMLEMRYGLESCKRTRDFDLLDMRKKIVDWQTINDDFSISLMEEKFGRIYSFDARDNKYLIASSPFYSTSKTKRIQYWDDEQWWGDQGRTSECVAYSWIHWLEDGPVYQPASPQPILNPNTVYKAAQKIDEWPGENYNGTSIRAGAKILQQEGFIQNYYWTRDVNVLANTILNTGPVVVGTYWYSNMMRPNLRTGLMSATGRILGAHAYVINGVDLNRRLFRIKNSWGRKWGLNGRAFISFTDMSRLMRMQGEVCLAIEKIKT